MIFQVTRLLIQADGDGNPVETRVSTDYRAELATGVFAVYETIESTEYKVVDQPWNFTDDGARIAWNTIDEGIAWFKQANGDLGENNG
jgi:hypothetical protein